jgi:DNA-binding response OmpR family regulator
LEAAQGGGQLHWTNTRSRITLSLEAMDGTRQICIMDNEKNVRRLDDFLAANGCRVTRCTSCGTRCAEEGRHPDVILLNCHDTDAALARIRTIRDNEELLHVPLIVYDSSGNRARMVSLLQNGATDYLRAPLLKEELLEKLAVHARLQSLLRSFARFHYDERESHTAKHNELTQKALELQRSFEQGSATVSYDVLDFLHDWLVTHIIGTDRKFGAFLAARGAASL